MQQAEPQVMAVPFGVVVPGRPVISTAQTISPGRWVVPIPEAHALRQVS